MYVWWRVQQDWKEQCLVPFHLLMEKLGIAHYLVYEMGYAVHEGKNEEN